MCDSGFLLVAAKLIQRLYNKAFSKQKHQFLLWMGFDRFLLYLTKYAFPSSQTKVFLKQQFFHEICIHNKKIHLNGLVAGRSRMQCFVETRETVLQFCRKQFGKDTFRKPLFLHHWTIDTFNNNEINYLNGIFLLPNGNKLFIINRKFFKKKRWAIKIQMRLFE